MSLGEFTEVWMAGRFDYDRQSHAGLVGLEMMMPEYWEEGYKTDRLM